MGERKEDAGAGEKEREGERRGWQRERRGDRDRQTQKGWCGAKAEEGVAEALIPTECKRGRGKLSRFLLSLAKERDRRLEAGWLARRGGWLK